MFPLLEAGAGLSSARANVAHPYPLETRGNAIKGNSISRRSPLPTRHIRIIAIPRDEVRWHAASSVSKTDLAAPGLGCSNWARFSTWRSSQRTQILVSTLEQWRATPAYKALGLLIAQLRTILSVIRPVSCPLRGSRQLWSAPRRTACANRSRCWLERRS